MLRSAPHLRRGALLIRGPRLSTVGPGAAEQRPGRCFASPGTLHRVRDKKKGHHAPIP